MNFLHTYNSNWNRFISRLCDFFIDYNFVLLVRCGGKQSPNKIPKAILSHFQIINTKQFWQNDCYTTRDMESHWYLLQHGQMVYIFVKYAGFNRYLEINFKKHIKKIFSSSLVLNYQVATGIESKKAALIMLSSLLFVYFFNLIFTDIFVVF